MFQIDDIRNEALLFKAPLLWYTKFRSSFIFHKDWKAKVNLIEFLIEFPIQVVS